MNEFNRLNFHRAAALAAILCLPAGFLEAKPQVIPVVSGLFSTGQWYFEGEKSSLGGNANLTVVPALKFSEKLSVIPTIQSSYRGTRSAEELAGGNTLFQDTWENAVSVKGVQTIGRRWRVRERVGVRTKWFRETTDETWGKGLYDYRIMTVGGEGEFKWNRRSSAALGYDFALLSFPNYSSLESGQTADLAREFSGDNVLDTTVHTLSGRSSIGLPLKIDSSLQLFYSPRFYSDQNVVILSGLLSGTERSDVFSGGSLKLERMFKGPGKSRFLADASYAITAFESNQNHYDARQTQFIADYFDYDQQSVGGSVSYAFRPGANGPMVAEIGGSYARRDYRHRVTQNAAGGYNSEKLYTVSTALDLVFSYPLTKFMRLRVSSTFGRTKSNNDYEELYRYNYNNANYQFGFVYEY